MGQAHWNQKLLNWIQSEKLKDQKYLDDEKKNLINQIKKINKNELFPKKEKISIWKKIRIIIWGN